MSRGYDFTVVVVIWIIAITIHRISVELFTPDGVLYSVATTGTENVNGTAIANTWFQIFTVWVPLIAGGGIIAWAVIREYRRQTTTNVRRVR